ncbi:MAG: hypothetical protein AAGN35_02635 [Bacteroidota bacterium]
MHTPQTNKQDQFQHGAAESNLSHEIGGQSFAAPSFQLAASSAEDHPGNIPMQAKAAADGLRSDNSPNNFPTNTAPVQRQGNPNAQPQDTQSLHQGGGSQKIFGVACSVSWIHPNSPAGRMPVVGVPDKQPPNKINESYINQADFRFSNHVGATVTTSDGKTIDNVDHHPVQITRGISQFGLQSQQYPTDRKTSRSVEGGVEFVEVKQLVGARTVSHEVVGEYAGKGIGAGVGAWAGAKGGAAIGTMIAPGIGTAIGGAIGAIGGSLFGSWLGGATGEKAASAAISFPPIWTEVGLRVYADGRINRRMIRHSLFPSVHFYGASNYAGGLNYLALDAEQTSWQNGGWGGGNPWGANRYDGRD